MLPNRHTIRLKGFDYSQQGYYFITICTQNRENLFGHIVGADPRVRPIRNDHVRPSMILNEFGKIIDKKINELHKYKNIDVDIYCVMPNHVHMIIHIGSTQGSTPTLGEYIKRFKTLTTKIYIENVKHNNWPLFDKHIWQRNYYEHIIRNKTKYIKIKEYIRLNPSMWERDRNNGEI